MHSQRLQFCYEVLQLFQLPISHPSHSFHSASVLWSWRLFQGFPFSFSIHPALWLKHPAIHVIPCSLSQASPSLLHPFLWSFRMCHVETEDAFLSSCKIVSQLYGWQIQLPVLESNRHALQSTSLLAFGVFLSCNSTSLALSSSSSKAAILSAMKSICAFNDFTTLSCACCVNLACCVCCCSSCNSCRNCLHSESFWAISDKSRSSRSFVVSNSILREAC
mmetsp:Transcript_3304/g.20583  ORF Transcript_3304/g.20583 Transcript_3304/m.20583 type:complete len:220 (+) Transcript_3304:1506-2165(+)